MPQILLESDSSSALQLLVGQDIPKRSRHVEIRMAWMKAKISSNELLVEHRAGTDNVADLFTKCLGTKDFLRHRTSLGFETPEVPMQDLHRVRDVMLINSRVDHKQDVAFVEVCCGTNSALRESLQSWTHALYRNSQTNGNTGHVSKGERGLLRFTNS